MRKNAGQFIGIHFVLPHAVRPIMIVRLAVDLCPFEAAHFPPSSPFPPSLYDKCVMNRNRMSELSVCGSAGGLIDRSVVIGERRERNVS